MINDTVEAFFEEVIDWPFEDIHPEAAVPTAAFNIAFKIPSRHGDQLEFTLTVSRIGRSSLTLRITALSGGAERLTAEQTLVCTGQSGTPAPWPHQVRHKIEQLLIANQNG